MLLRSKQVPLEFHADPRKFKKYHKIKYAQSKIYTSTQVGGTSLIVNENKAFTSKQLLVLLKLLKPLLKTVKSSRVKLSIKLDDVLTKKPKDIRMGRGKGAPTDRVFNLKSGCDLFTLY